MVSMRTAVCYQRRRGSCAWKGVTIDAPKRNEVLVRMAASGVCHTGPFRSSQGIMLKRSFTCVLGHEGSELVGRLGDGVERILKGRRTASSCRKVTPCRGSATTVASASPIASEVGAHINTITPVPADGKCLAMHRDGADLQAFCGAGATLRGNGGGVNLRRVRVKLPGRTRRSDRN
jgi:Zn-dependent alcohol dehydrogenase